MLLRPKTGLKDMTVELNPGTTRRAAARRRDDPGRPDPARRQPRRVPRRAGLRHARLPDVLLNDGGRGAQGQRPRLAQRSGASSRRARARAHQRRAGDAPRRTSSASIHNFSLVPDELGGKRRRPRRLRDELERGVRACWPSQDADIRATLAQLPPTLDATKRRWARPARSPTSSARRSTPCGRAPARWRRRSAQMRPFLRKTTPIIHDELRPLHARGAPTVSELRPAMRDARGGDARPHDHAQDPQLPGQRARLQPAGRRARATCSGSPGPTTSAPTIFNTQDAQGRSAAASWSSAARPPPCWTRSRPSTRSWARSSTCSTARTARASARRPPRTRWAEADAEVRPLTRPDRRDGRVRALVAEVVDGGQHGARAPGQVAGYRGGERVGVIGRRRPGGRRAGRRAQRGQRRVRAGRLGAAGRGAAPPGASVPVTSPGAMDGAGAGPPTGPPSVAANAANPPSSAHTAATASTAMPVRPLHRPLAAAARSVGGRGVGASPVGRPRRFFLGAGGSSAPAGRRRPRSEPATPPSRTVTAGRRRAAALPRVPAAGSSGLLA